jgi:hypothetical protein
VLSLPLARNGHGLSVGRGSINWIIDLDAPPSLRAFTLVGDVYELSGEFTAAVTLDVAGHPVTVDPAAIVRR